MQILQRQDGKTHSSQMRCQSKTTEHKRGRLSAKGQSIRHISLGQRKKVGHSQNKRWFLGLVCIARQVTTSIQAILEVRVGFHEESCRGR